MTLIDIRAHGAVGDGVTNDAPAIQAAIDEVAEAGGGTVIVPAGATFLSGSIVLRTAVELHVERGAVLQASGDWGHMTARRTVGALSNGIISELSEQSASFITAEGATDVAITGGGTIDGGGRFYVLRDLGEIYEMPKARPFTLFLVDCRDVVIRDVLWRDGALWTVRLSGCEGVLIHGIRIRSDMKTPNADGIDLDRCRRVRISDCDISCPDDAISLKTCEEFPDSGDCSDITVTGCVLETRSSALVVGVDAVAPIRNVVFSACVIRNSHRGLSVNLGQDALYENILFTDIVVETRLFDDAWWGRGEPIYVSAFPWQEQIGRIRNVRFVNVLAKGESGVHVSAHRPGLIEGLVLDRVRVEVDKWSDVEGGVVDRRPFSGDPALVAADVPGFLIDTASDVTVRDCEVVWGEHRQPFWGAALEVRDVEGLRLSGFRGVAGRPGLDAVVGA